MWKKLLSFSSPFAHDLALLPLRVGFGLSLALVHGWPKASDISGFTAKIASGVPLPQILGPAAALTEFVGGLLLVVGLFTRPAAGFVFINMMVAAFHIHRSDPYAVKELALAYSAVMAALMIAGPGKFSLDARLFGEKSSSD